MDERIQPIFNAILEGDQHTVEQGVHAALQSGISPGQILSDAMFTAMSEVGYQYEQGEFFVPEMLVAARAMKAGMEILRPHLRLGDLQPAGRVVIGTVKGDYHDVGKNLVMIMLEGAGFEIIDLGTDVPPERFVQTVIDQSADILALSALLTTTLGYMQNTINALQAVGLRPQVKVIVGGAPVTAAFAAEIGADGYAPDASRAVSVAKSLLA